MMSFRLITMVVICLRLGHGTTGEPTGFGGATGGGAGDLGFFEARAASYAFVQSRRNAASFGSIVSARPPVRDAIA